MLWGAERCCPRELATAIRRDPRIRERDKNAPRINHQIRAREIRVIDEDGGQLGVMPPQEALAMAVEKSLDLVEVAAQSSPPVCRLMDYGKYKYEQAKRAREAKKHQHQMAVKEMKFRPKTSEHDYDFKKNHVREFLDGNDKVKVTVMFRGREMAHPEVGQALLHRLIQDVQDVGAVESLPKMEGRLMTLVLVPKR